MVERHENVLGSQMIWFHGVVENRSDPLKLNRLQVRCLMHHSGDLTNIPSADLPWAYSTLTKPPIEGSWVIGYFIDGENAQQPVIIGVIPGIPEATPPINQGFSDQRSSSVLASSPAPPKSTTYNTSGSGAITTNASAALRNPNVLNQPTTSRLARNYQINQTIVQQKQNSLDKNVPTANNTTWSEPAPAYNATYPFNTVDQSDSNHVIEVDDTPGHERLHRWHRAGTFEEIQPNGQRVFKVVQNNYEIIMGSDFVHVMGAQSVTIQGAQSILVQGNAMLTVNGNVTETVKGNLTRTVQGNVSDTVQGNYDLTVSGTYTVHNDTTIDGNLTIEDNLTVDEDVDISGDVTVDGTVTASDFLIS